MNSIEFVDSHIHLYDMKHPELFYGHWQPGVPHPTLGDQIQKLAERSYFAEDYILETRNSNVIKAVHVQAAIGSKDPVKETEWLQEAADRTGFPHGIIGYADLSHPDVENVLERHCEFPNMRGIRDFGEGDYLVNSAFHKGFALLDKYDLRVSVGVEWQNMENLRIMADRSPNTLIVVDHAGLPQARSNEYFVQWKKGMDTVAQSDNIRCKISGLGMGDQNWTVSSIRPYGLHCIETFGVERCFFGSNWPVDWLWSSYDDLINAYTEITSDFTLQEQIALFSQNAESIYDI
jgi:predicted TIM-barrel fold metal-dependent hydrolase